LKDVKFVKEKRLVSSFFEEIAQDTGKYCFGIRDSLYSCEAGAVHTLIVYENLDLERFVVITPEGDKVLYYTTEQAEKPDAFKDAKSGVDWEVKDKISLVEWLAENYKKFGCSLQFVTDRSQEGMQFVKGFGGIGALLRYKLEFSVLDAEEAKKDDEVLEKLVAERGADDPLGADVGTVRIKGQDGLDALGTVRYKPGEKYGTFQFYGTVRVNTGGSESVDTSGDVPDWLNPSAVKIDKSDIAAAASSGTVRIAGGQEDAPAGVHAVEPAGQLRRTHPADDGHRADAIRQAVQDGQGIRGTA